MTRLSFLRSTIESVYFQIYLEFCLKPTWDWLLTVMDATEAQLRFGLLWHIPLTQDIRAMLSVVEWILEVGNIQLLPLVPHLVFWVCMRMDALRQNVLYCIIAFGFAEKCRFSFILTKDFMVACIGNDFDKLKILCNDWESTVEL